MRLYKTQDINIRYKMIEIINLQKLLGNIYNGNISLAAKLYKYRYLRKEDFGLRFLYVMTRMLYRIITSPSPAPNMKNRPTTISKESLQWCIKKNSYLTKEETDIILKQLDQCMFRASYSCR